MIKGALAGLIGTAAMTAAQTAQMRVTGRQPSMAPVLHKGVYVAVTNRV